MGPAPLALSSRTAPHRVPAVSIMSSLMMQVLPSMSPMMPMTSAWLWEGRPLWAMASEQPSESARRLEALARPTSGETTTVLSMSKPLAA